MRNQLAETYLKKLPLRFLVGRDAAGHWLAKAAGGDCGGLFINRDAALHFALAESGFHHERVELVDGEMTLDL